MYDVNKRTMSNIQWEQHKDGNYYAYRNGHELIGSVRLSNSRQIAECHITLTAQKFENLTEAKQWVVDKVKLWLEKAGL